MVFPEMVAIHLEASVCTATASSTSKTATDPKAAKTPATTTTTKAADPKAAAAATPSTAKSATGTDTKNSLAASTGDTREFYTETYDIAKLFIPGEKIKIEIL